jgi:hypothetical protein
VYLTHARRYPFGLPTPWRRSVWEVNSRPAVENISSLLLNRGSLPFSREPFSGLILGLLNLHIERFRTICSRFVLILFSRRSPGFQVAFSLQFADWISYVSHPCYIPIHLALDIFTATYTAGSVSEVKEAGT